MKSSIDGIISYCSPAKTGENHKVKSYLSNHLRRPVVLIVEFEQTTFFFWYLQVIIYSSLVYGKILWKMKIVHIL